MGFFDLLTPIFGWLDTKLLGGIWDIARLVLWAAAGSALSMLIYARLSPQQDLLNIRKQIAEGREALLRADDDWDAAWPRVRRLIVLSLRRVRLTLTPAIAASLPILFLIGWISNSYGFKMPTPGSPVEFTVYTDDAAAREILGADAVQTPRTWVQSWPQAGKALLLRDPGSDTDLRLEMVAPVPVIHKRKWWNILFGNPLGYLPDQGVAHTVKFKLEPRKLLNGVPSPLSGWEAIFFSAVVMFSLLFKFALRIE